MKNFQFSILRQVQDKFFNFQFLILFAILLCATFFRFYNLTSVPPSPSLDEVSIGYNAYSVLQTGRDEYGEKFPILLRAYDDWRPALYAYLVIPFVKLFGLNVFAVRLPAAILSIFTVVATYFLTKEILIKRPKTKDQRLKTIIPIIAAAMLAISPWHVYFSRVGHEWNGALSFFVFGLVFFMKFINSINQRLNTYSSSETQAESISRGSRQARTIMGNRRFSLFFAAICFGLSFDFYQSAKIFIPIFMIVLIVFFHKELLLRKYTTIIYIIIVILVALPILFASFSPNALIRFQGTNIFQAQHELFERSAQKIVEDKKNNNLLGLIVDNRRWLYVLIPARAYLSHFNYSWLFANSGTEPFKVPDFGLLYPFELPLLILGVIYLIKTDIIPIRIKLVIMFWVLASILPASITTGYPHAARVYTIVPTLEIVGAVGFYFILDKISAIKNYLLKRVSIVVIAIIVSLFVFRFYHAYFVNFPKKLSNQFQYGAIQSLSYADSISNQYDRVVVSNKDNLYQSYMFYLFSTEYDPFKYQKMGGTRSGGFDESHKIGKFEFGKVDFVQDRNILYVVNPRELPEERIKILHKVKFLNGEEAVWIVSRK